MKKILSIFALVLFFCLSTPFKAKAQYVRVNIDYETVAAMISAYGSETLAEKYYNSQIEKILDRYTTAEVAAAGIFASKYLDRKALTTLGIWGDGTQNYYYKRIYQLVASKIMPKIWTVAGMMLKSPQTALYWGSYLMKICAETKALCYQFESVVTNSTLSFDTVAFLEFNPEIAALLDITQIGGIDWQRMLNDFSEISSNFTKENLIADLDNLYSMASTIVASGVGNAVDQLLDQSDFDALFKGQLLKVVDIIDHYETINKSLDQSVGDTLLGLVGGPDSVAQLFNLSNYNMTAWMVDYANRDPDTYYTQRWYIYAKDSKIETLCSYEPPRDVESILYDIEWTKYRTTSPAYTPTSIQKEVILRNSESCAGWSRNRIDQLNAANDGYEYSMDTMLNEFTIISEGAQTGKAYAYSIYVTRSRNRYEEVYEEVFDSYSMDYNAFKAQLNVKLKEYNSNEDGLTYYLACDSKNYYRATDEAKLAGCESVIISASCHDGAELGSGTTQYKCGTCGKTLTAHVKECSMLTTIPASDELDTSELDVKEQDLRNKIAITESQILQLEESNKQIIAQISEADVVTAAILRSQYNSNTNQISQLKSNLAALQAELDEVLRAKEEALSDNENVTDDYYRIPAIMQDLQTAYSLTWTDEGTWGGYAFTRYATSKGINGTLTFQATMSMARPAKYFLGIKIHRAIIQIEWKLTGEFSDTQIVDIINLDPNALDEDKQKVVNERISQAAQDYPKCQITTEYVKRDPLETDTTDDMYHLLWASDRLEIARNVEVRLAHIYADLVCLEKMMHYKLNIIDVLKGIAPNMNDNAGRKQNAIQQSYERWLKSAKFQKGEQP